MFSRINNRMWQFNLGSLCITKQDNSVIIWLGRYKKISFESLKYSEYPSIISVLDMMIRPKSILRGLASEQLKKIVDDASKIDGI